MGTSVQMIQLYYGKQATAAVFATRLGNQSWPEKPGYRNYKQGKVAMEARHDT